MKKQYNKLEFVTLKVHMFDIYLLLKSLELYNFTLNNCWISNVDKETMKNRNDIIFYLYHSLLDLYTKEYDIDTRIKISKEINSDIA